MTLPAKSTVTLKQIAVAANSSTSTVLRALSGRGPVSSETRQRVQRVAAELGYRVDWRGRSMVTGKTGLLGLLVQTEDEVWFAYRLIVALQQALGQTDHKVILVPTGDLLEHEESALESMWQRRVEGVIAVSGSNAWQSRHFEELARRGVPVVLINRYTDATGVHKVLFDHRRSGFDATQRLLSAGHPLVGFIGNGSNCSLQAQSEAALGYREAMKSIGRFDPSLEVGREQNWRPSVQLEAGIEGARELMERHPRLSAIVAADPYKYAGALRWLHEHGYRVPQDVALISRGYSPDTGFLRPEPSTYAFPWDETAVLAASLLLHDKQPDTHVLSLKFERHESCGTGALT